MTTLITSQTAAGKKYRCNAKCYDAKGSRCSCCCGGRNHGKGLKAAIEISRDFLEATFTDPANNWPKNGDVIFFSGQVNQVRLIP